MSGAAMQRSLEIHGSTPVLPPAGMLLWLSTFALPLNRGPAALYYDIQRRLAAAIRPFARDSEI